MPRVNRLEMMKQAFWVALIPGAILFAWMQFHGYAVRGMIGVDSHAYWAAARDPASWYTRPPAPPGTPISTRPPSHRSCGPWRACPGRCSRPCGSPVRSGSCLADEAARMAAHPGPQSRSSLASCSWATCTSSSAPCWCWRSRSRLAFLPFPFSRRSPLVLSACGSWLAGTGEVSPGQWARVPSSSAPPCSSTSTLVALGSVPAFRIGFWPGGVDHDSSWCGDPPGALRSKDRKVSGCLHPPSSWGVRCLGAPTSWQCSRLCRACWPVTGRWCPLQRPGRRRTKP